GGVGGLLDGSHCGGSFRWCGWCDSAGCVLVLVVGGTRPRQRDRSPSQPAGGDSQWVSAGSSVSAASGEGPPACSRSARKRSASSAAAQPEPAAVMACR